MLSALLSLFMIGIVGLIVGSVVLAVIGAVFSVAFGLIGLLLFKVAPVLLIGWLALKLVERVRRPRSGISAADQKWLDG
jgi:FtsH-binding integral membrane protein